MGTRGIEGSRTSHVAMGMLGCLFVLAAIVLAVATNRGLFKPTVRIDLVSDRAGLMLEPGSDVRLRGVVVGRVDTVELVGGKARIAMDIDADWAREIPTNTSAAIDLSTLFGRKFVAFTWPEQPAATHLTPGVRMIAESVPTEFDELLEKLVVVLRAVEPQKVSGALNALSTALHGRGDGLGDMLVELDGFLAQFNGSLPALQRDLTAAAQTAGVLADASPELLRAVENLTTTGRTLTEKQTELSSFLLSFTEFGNSGKSLFANVGAPLTESMRSLVPTTALLAEHASALPCFVTSLEQSNAYLERTIGGSANPGLNIVATLLMGDPPYAYPADLPIVAADGPAKCYDWSQPPGHTDFNDGSHPYGPVRTPLDLLGNPFAQFLPRPGAGR
ncbi:MCE family protein [Nocardia cyriacigeorgica]|uniref:MCE family protein n=3 Tax=Nocardia cyriacigeorgica TaxID=135487 RepID=UPI00189528E4|nr:MCE family protein [Nocardia cyriacigeorgica]MBF6290093.1 MCE family protein [Nocardia cyriacigeorgica]